MEMCWGVDEYQVYLCSDNVIVHVLEADRGIGVLLWFRFKLIKLSVKFITFGNKSKFESLDKNE